MLAALKRKHESRNTWLDRRKRSGGLTEPRYVTESGMLTEVREKHFRKTPCAQTKYESRITRYERRKRQWETHVADVLHRAANVDRGDGCALVKGTLRSNKARVTKHTV